MIDQMNLAAAGVACQVADLPVDEHLRTSNSHVYAVGDVGGSPVPKLVPTGNYEGRYVAQVIAGKTNAPISYPTTPINYEFIGEQKCKTVKCVSVKNCTSQGRY